MAELTWRATELHRCDVGTIVLDLVEGFDSESEVSGRDVLIPGREGMYVPANSREKRRRVVRLRGFVKGIGADDTEREQSYRSLIDELHTIFDPTLDPEDMTVTAPYLGLASGFSILPDVRYLNAVWGPFIRRSFRTVDVEMESIGSPPDWSPPSPGS
jgi:hypothetical protein